MEGVVNPMVLWVYVYLLEYFGSVVISILSRPDLFSAVSKGAKFENSPPGASAYISLC